MTMTRDRRRELLDEKWSPPKNPILRILAPVNNKIVGIRFMVTAFIFLLLAGLEATVMRTQLAIPENTFLDPDLYNQLFTMHGSTMMFLFIIPFLEGLAIYVVPAMIGARDMTYPRLSAWGYWIYLLGGLMFYASFFVGSVPDAGWFSYAPLSGPEYSDISQDFWLLGLSMVELSGIAAGIELITTILKLRSPGMSITRMPIFVWAMLVTAFMMMFAFTVLLVATLLLELERGFGFHFFNPDTGGSPLLWQHLFWIFGHPEVYIMFIPGTGIISTLVPVFARRGLVAYRLVILALLVTGFVSFGLWAHHMFTSGLPDLALAFFTASSFIIALATGTQIFSWIATLWGRRPLFTVPMLYVIGFFIVFMLGGVTGVMVAAVPFDLLAHDSYFVVAHFHYVIVGGVVLPALGAIHYWLPKMSGRMMSERLGKVAFWVIFISFNVTFFPMHIAGLIGMPRRVYTFQEEVGLSGYNLVSTSGSYVLALGFLLFVINVIRSLLNGPKAPDNPWGAGTLDWAGDSPMPSYSVAKPFVVKSRYPLWYEDETREPDEEELQAASAALDLAPVEWRAGLITSSYGGEVRGVIFYPTPTLAPLFSAIGVFLLFLSVLIKSIWVAAAGFVVGVIATAVWLWPGPKERRFVRMSNTFLDPEGRRRWPGNDEVGTMGVALLATVAGTVQVVLLFSYLYLTGFSGPDEGPDWLLPAIATGVLAASGIFSLLANRDAHAERRRVLPLLGVSVLAGAGYLALQVLSLLQLEFTPQVDAYSSAFWVVNAFALFLVLVGIVLKLVTLGRVRTGILDHTTAPLLNSVIFWAVTVGVVIVSFLVLYVIPLL